VPSGHGRGKYPAILHLGIVIAIAFAQVRRTLEPGPLAGLMIRCAASHSRSCMTERWQCRTCHLGPRNEGEEAAYTAESGRFCNQGGACGAASGAPRAGLCLGGPPGAPAPSHCQAAVTRLLITQGGEVPSSSASIIRIAATASRAALRAVACDRLRRP